MDELNKASVHKMSEDTIGIRARGVVVKNDTTDSNVLVEEDESEQSVPFFVLVQGFGADRDPELWPRRHVLAHQDRIDLPRNLFLKIELFRAICFFVYYHF